MTAEFTPTTEDVRERYWLATVNDTDFPGAEGAASRLRAEFDRWLAQHDAEVKAEAWDEGAQAARNEDFLADDFVETPNPYRAEETNRD